MSARRGAVQLDRLQLAWLQELGVQAALLRPYAAAQRVKTRVANAMVHVRADAHAADGASVPYDTSRMSAARLTSTAPPALTTRPSASLAQVVGQGPQRARMAAAARQSAPPPPPPHRLVHLACQRYAAQHGATGAHQASSADWLIVSETTAVANDMRTLVPGRAAQLLHAMLAAVRMQPTDGIVRFQRNLVLPQTHATDGGHAVPASSPTLQDQISDPVAAVRPACILALGRAVAGALLQTTETLESLRGRVWSYPDATGQSIPVVVTYPPGWLLANPQHKAEVWRDLLLARVAHSP